MIAPRQSHQWLPVDSTGHVSPLSPPLRLIISHHMVITTMFRSDVSDTRLSFMGTTLYIFFSCCTAFRSMMVPTHDYGSVTERALKNSKERAVNPSKRGSSQNVRLRFGASRSRKGSCLGAIDVEWLGTTAFTAMRNRLPPLNFVIFLPTRPLLRACSNTWLTWIEPPEPWDARLPHHVIGKFKKMEWVTQTSLRVFNVN